MAMFRNVLFVATTAIVLQGCSSEPTPSPGTKVGDKQQCINLANIDHTYVVDDQTILVTMKGRHEFKRIDLLDRCVGLKIEGGFAYETSIQELCKQDPLRVIRGGGEICMIKQIVTIDPDEAKALREKR